MEPQEILQKWTENREVMWLNPVKQVAFDFFAKDGEPDSWVIKTWDGRLVAVFGLDQQAAAVEAVGFHNANLSPPKHLRQNMRCFSVPAEKVPMNRVVEDPTFFHKLLGVPYGAIICGLSPHHSFVQNKLVIRVVHDTFPVIPEGHTVQVEEVP